MTGDEFPHTIAGRIVEVAKVVAAIGIILGSATTLWAFTYGPVALFLDQWRTMQIDIAELQDNMRQVQGEDRVIRETPGLTYVSEPVYENEQVVFNFVAERTRLGRTCILQHSQPIFTDILNTPTPGLKREAARQIRDDPTPLRPGYTPPANLRPGRVTLYLILVYTCDGRTVFDQTSTAAFELIEGPRP